MYQQNNKKIFWLKIFLICHRCRWHRWSTLSWEYLREFAKNFETVPMGYSGAGGKLIDEKNQKRKISWHCPFKLSSLWERNVRHYYTRSSSKAEHILILLVRFERPAPVYLGFQQRPGSDPSLYRDVGGPPYLFTLILRSQNIQHFVSILIAGF